jgi:phosphoribosylformylglycinamidine synthase
MVGLIDAPEKVMTADFKTPGDLIMVLGVTDGHSDGSEYLAMVAASGANGASGSPAGFAPPIDLKAEHRLHDLLRDLIAGGLIKSAHDCSEGGLAICLAESVLASARSGRQVGIKARIPGSIRPDFYLFGEDQSRVVVSLEPGRLAAVKTAAEKYRTACETIGQVSDGRYVIEGLIDLDPGALIEAAEPGLESFLKGIGGKG